MKKNIFFFLFSLSIVSYSQTKVGNIGFNDIDVFDSAELMLSGAGQIEKLYAIGLYLDFEVEGVEDGIMVADKDATMAVTIKTASFMSREDMKILIRNGLERATDGNSYLLEDQIRSFLQLFPKEIKKYEIFKIVYSDDKKLTLYKNKERLGAITNSLEFKKALFKIWLGENPEDPKLKEDLLGSFKANPILGQWKTFDKETGVAINIVQLYMIENKIYGSVQRMLRQSERDAVCYKCEGDDKNQKVEGLVILKRLRSKDENKYVDGTYTNIVDGRVSDCQMWIDKKDTNILNVKYKGGGVHRWKRVIESKKKKQSDYRTARGF